MQRKRRLPQLQFKSGFAVGFATPIPEAFAEALRKKELSKGDIFFSDRDAYGVAWATAIQQIKWLIQIKESMTGGETVFFDFYRPNTLLGSVYVEVTAKLHWEDFVARLKSAEFGGIATVD